MSTCTTGFPAAAIRVVTLKAALPRSLREGAQQRRQGGVGRRHCSDNGRAVSCHEAADRAADWLQQADSCREPTQKASRRQPARLRGLESRCGA